jgi:hypothetical protein
VTTTADARPVAVNDDLAHATVRWLGGLFALCVLLQRIAVPGLPVALILPLVVLGAAWGYARGLAEIDGRRMIAWLLAACVTAVAMVVHAAVLDRPSVSVTSWGLFVTVWLPFTLRLVDRRLSTYVQLLRSVVTTTAVLAGLCVIMMLTQFGGLPYRDWMAEAVPGAFLLDGFVITYPIVYDSPIYRANGWIGLEPSMVSLYMGVGVLAAMLVHSRAWVLTLLVGGLVAATSGSGFAIVAVGVVVLAITPARHLLRRYVGVATLLVLLALSTPMGRSIINRLGEGGTDQSSTSLRAIYPYEYLWPSWIVDASTVLLGLGPGSSQSAASESGVMGLMVPSPIKIFYDFGLVAGAFLAAMILICYVGGHSRVLSIALLFSLWTLQPGTTTTLVIVPLMLLVTWWSPRPQESTMEELLSGNRRREGEARSVPRWVADDEQQETGDTYVD